MGIFLLILVFVLIFFSFLFDKKEDIFYNLRISFLKASLIISFLIVLITEILSIFNGITRLNILISWFFIFLFSLIVFILLLQKNKYSVDIIKNIIKDFFKKILLFKKINCCFKVEIVLIIVIVLSLFFICFTINNNWDSYTYHLPRVEHWIQNKNVNFYPTENIRQLYLAPFSEYSILNIRLLSESFIFLNFVQFFAMINSLIVVSLIVKLFKLSFRWQLFSIILVLTIPMGILQSVTTQTDYLVSFFLISFIFFGLVLIQNINISYYNLFFLAISFSLGILTKSTFYIFAFPFCVFFGVYLLKRFSLKSIYIVFYIVSTFVLVNFSFLYRNYNQFHSVLGPQKTSSYYLANLNEEFGVRVMFSNSIKNIGLHLALPFYKWNIKVDKVINKIHSDFIKFPLNDNKTNWYGIEYITSFTMHHDLVGNFLHIILFFISVIIFIITIFKLKVVNKIEFLYLLALIFSFLMFAFLLKWQPWQTRLDLPFFIIMTPFIVFTFSKLNLRKLSTIISFIFLFSAILIIFFLDPNKTIIGENSIFIRNNEEYIFGYKVADEINNKLKENNISDTGLVLRGDSWEWQYWLLSKDIRFEYIYFRQKLLKTVNYDKNFKYKAIIVDNDKAMKEISLDKDLIKEYINLNEKIKLIIFKEEQKSIFTY